MLELEIYIKYSTGFEFLSFELNFLKSLFDHRKSDNRATAYQAPKAVDTVHKKYLNLASI